MRLNKMPRILYGGDYNPDQWPREVWDDDMRLFKKAHVNVATVAVFSWAYLQPNEEEFNFGWLDEIMDRLHKEGIVACLATSTAAQPAWLDKKYPGVLPVTIDGLRRGHGARMNFCPNSPDHRRAAQRIARALAERYGKHPALAIWHVSNEYGPYCYCDKCASAFRVWLKNRYKTIEELNRVWYLSFWGHTVYDWEEVVPPSFLTEEMVRDNRHASSFQSISLDYRRFMSDSNLACYLGEANILREVTPNVPITTNLMGSYKPLDYFSWAPHLDVVSWDSYPTLNDDVSNIALRHDLMRGLKDGEPFMLMEQTPSQQNWQAYNSLKRPGVMRLWSYQAVAHGADTVMFFQLRRSRGASEKYHGALIEHVGHENTRVYRECEELGGELESLGDALLDSRTPARVAIVFDWENWWAAELSSGPSVALNYVPQIQKHYRAFYRQNVPVDIISEKTLAEGDLSKYEIIVAPVMYMVKPGVAQGIESFVQGGGAFVTTFFSGVADEHDLAVLGGYPGELRKVMGVWVEEIDALYPDMKNSIVVGSDLGRVSGSYECGLLCDLIHAEGSRVLATYGSDFYAGMPVLTENSFGAGKAFYIASDPEERFLDDLYGELCAVKGIEPILKAPPGVEATRRSRDGREFTFVLNHNAEEVTVNLGKEQRRELLTGVELSGDVTITGRGVMILESAK